MAECAEPVPLRDTGDGHAYLCRLPPGWTQAEAG
jgi:hypothetical protein